MIVSHSWPRDRYLGRDQQPYAGSLHNCLVLSLEAVPIS